MFISILIKQYIYSKGINKNNDLEFYYKENSWNAIDILGHLPYCE